MRNLNPFRARPSPKGLAPDGSVVAQRLADLVLPVYLDTNLLLDLLASVEGGFSTVERVTTRLSEARKSETSGEVSGRTGFGIPQVAELLRVDLKGIASATGEHLSGEERSADRYHTAGSLFNRLRETLSHASLLALETPEAWQRATPSAFVEARGRFVPNPLLAGLQTMDRLLEMLSELGSTATNVKQTKDVQRYRKMLEGMIKDFRPERSQTFEVHLTSLPGYKVVVYLVTDFMRDQSGAELADGEFRVLGKVVTKLEADESIDLLHGSGLGALGDELLAPMVSAFQQIDQAKVKIPHVVTKVAPPAMRIIPVAVYV